MPSDSSRSRAREDQRAARDAAVSELLEHFYPVHYQIGMAIEDVLRDRLSRKQFAILWLIHSEGDGGLRMRRKQIEAAMRRWFEVSSPAISQALRVLARPPLELIEVRVDPNSGRERVVSLTPAGVRFLEETTARAERFVGKLVAESPVELIRQSSAFFRRSSEGLRKVSARSRLRAIRGLED